MKSNRSKHFWSGMMIKTVVKCPWLVVLGLTTSWKALPWDFTYIYQLEVCENKCHMELSAM